MKRRWKLVGIVLLAGVVLSAARVWQVRGERERESDSERRSLCMDLVLQPRLKPQQPGATLPEAQTPPAPPGWGIVEVKPGFDPGVMWRYVNDFLKAPDGERAEAVTDPGVALDLVLESRRDRDGSVGYRSRHVILADRAWVEDAATGQRVECVRPPEHVPANLLLSRPFEGWGIEGSGLWAFPDPLRTPSVVARPIGERTQAGEALALYEMLPSEKLPHLRSMFALDGNGRLRYHEVTDARSGEVVLHREADPVPDHPPIGDPTGQPVISAD